MTSAPLNAQQNGPGYTAAGWLLSGLLHGSLILGAVLFLHRIQLAPEPEPFTWNVAMVEPTPVDHRPVKELSPAPPPSANLADTPTPVPVTPVTPPARMVEPLPQTPVSSKEPAHEALQDKTVPPAPITQTNRPARSQDMSGSSAPPSSITSMNGPEPSAAKPQHEVPTAAPPDSSPRMQSLPPQPVPPSASETIPSPRADSVPVPPQTSDAPSSPEGPQVAAIPPAAQPKTMKPDYGWLSDLMARWIENLDKRYPVMLRTDGIEGKVTLTAVLHDDGVLSDVRIAKSSGNVMLDQVAVDDVKKGPPIKLSRPLERSQMPVKFSIVYDLKTVQ